jgi:uncharacterized membrane protein SirB2
MKLLLETVLSVSGILIFFAIAFFAPSFFWIGLVFLLVLETIAFILGYFRKKKNPEQTLEEVVETLEEDKKEEK